MCTKWLTLSALPLPPPFGHSAERDRLLAPTGIRTVPSLQWPGGQHAHGGAGRLFAFPGPDPLRGLTQLMMACRTRLAAGAAAADDAGVDGRQWVEGLYVRVEEGPWLRHRTKLVHPAFKQVPTCALRPAWGVHACLHTGGVYPPAQVVRTHAQRSLVIGRTSQ